MVYSHKLSASRNRTGGARQFFSIVLGCWFATGLAQATDVNLKQTFSQNLPRYVLSNLSNESRTDSSNVLQSESHIESRSESVSVSSSISSATKLFVSSGLKELVGQIPVSTASSFEAALTSQQLPDLLRSLDQQDLGAAVDNAFKSETFNKYIVQQLSTGMSVQAREFMIVWYASALGARVRQAEMENSLLTEQTRFENYQVFLNRYPVDAIREELIKKLDVTMKSTESAMDMMGSIQVAFNLSLTRFMPEEHRLSRQEMLDMVSQSKDELLSHYEKKTKEVLLFTYHTLNNEDLVQLNDTLATQAGQDFVVAINTGIKKGMFAASLDLGDGFGALLDALPKNSGI